MSMILIDVVTFWFLIETLEKKDLSERLRMTAEYGGGFGSLALCPILLRFTSSLEDTIAICLVQL